MTSNALRCVACMVLQSFLLAGFGVVTAAAQEPAAPMVGAASLNQVADELRGRFGEVRFHRDEALEDRFVVHGLKSSDFGLLPRFFQLQEPRFDYSRGFLMENTTNALPTMYVASSSDGAKVYRLYGFPTPEEEFNRLVVNGPAQKIGGSTDAETRGLLCAEVVYGLSSQWWVADPSNAQLQAAEHFFSAGHKDGLLRGEKWWEAIKGDRATLAIQTVKNDHGGFSVNLPMFWAPVEGSVVPQIRIYRIEVGETGSCHMDRKPVSVLK
jgi:hypothetical protein